MSEAGVRAAVVALVTVAALLRTAAIEAQGTNPPYLSQMPPVERVLRDIQGADSIDTAARQAGVFWQLQGVIRNLARSQHRTDRQFTPDETRFNSEYRNAYYSVWLPVQNALAQDRPRLFKLEGYTTNGDLLAEALERLSSPAFRAEYDKAVGQVDARVQARKSADPLMAKPATGANPSGVDSQPCRVTGAPGPAKPSTRGNSSLIVYGGYKLTFWDQYGNVTSEKRGNFADTTLYLVDSDVENVLQAAGVDPTWSGFRVEAVAFYDAFSEVGNLPAVAAFESLLGDDSLGEGAKADFECAMKAISARSVAQMTVGANGTGHFTGIPAGTYYLYGRFYQVKGPPRAGGMVWNLKVVVKPGSNEVVLSPDNAAFKSGN